MTERQRNIHIDGMTPEEARAMFPSSPALWPTLAPAVELSTDRHRRAAQLAFPNSPGCWPPERDLDAEYRGLEAKHDEVAKMFPNSAARMIQPLVNSAVNAVTQGLIDIDRDLDRQRAERDAAREAAAPAAGSEPTT
jgi:hypothetical protein